ncbi:hemagglutinin repeat-containing protein [Desulfovibrio litoralis]|uniref:Haemagluttinin repeat-containing protein n=1 Tax=Desulfovibrio litoralis DSM 11393 TaxID=1121455 RepID=A0A1M7TGT6_9BACT|nr:hemagglutinin repeat-containing protein [Desulfovibrio litoralis]SHN69925.1 Haemagluttinin repeat-containing protein [Desulfovibrio litoralis DSM 11393]
MKTTKQAYPCHTSTKPCFSVMKRNRFLILSLSSLSKKLMRCFSLVVQHTVISILIFMLAMPPVAFAGGIVADPSANANNRPSVDAAQNGVPVVNIVAPNQSGLSHNKYSDFNVQNQGAILNNSAKAGVSQLGGIVAGNPNVAGSRSASAILNEVTSSNRSHIEGYIEVFGEKADVILANPNGVTINGGGFLNTNRATVTTGKTVLGADGSLQQLDVRQGSVNVEGMGINASNVTGFDIISRAAQINAEVYAKDLNVVAGANTYEVKTGKVTALQPDGSQPPVVAIDSSALGGMYAGKITLVSTEKGVGVNLQGLVQAENDLDITSEGKLTVRAAKAGNNLVVKANENTVKVNEALVAGKDLHMEGANLEGQRVTIHAGDNLFMWSDSATVFGDGSLLSARLKAELAAMETSLTNNTTLQGQNVAVQTENLNLSNSKILAEHDVKLASDVSSLSDSTIMAGRDIALSSTTLHSTGEAITSVAGLDVGSTNGSIYAGRDLNISVLSSALFSGGFYGAGNILDVSGQSMGTTQQVALYAGGSALFTFSNDLNFIDTNFVFDGNAQVSANAVSLAQSSVSTAGTLELDAVEDITVGASSALLGFGGLELFANNLTNKGLIFSGDILFAHVRNLFANMDGADLLSQGNMILTGRDAGTRMAKLHNRASTIESLTGGIAVDADVLHNEGTGVQIQKTVDDFDYTIIGWVGDPNGNDSNAVSFDDGFWSRYGFDRSRSPDLPFGPDGSKNYLTSRVQLKKRQGDVANYVYAMQGQYGIPAYIPNKGEGMQEWLYYTSDKIITPAKSASLMAGTNIVLNVGRLENTLSTISAGGDMSITADTLVNQGVDLRAYMEGERYFVGTGSSGTFELAQKDSVYFSIAEVVGAVPSVITAAGLLILDVTDQINNSTLMGGEEYLGKTSGTPAFSDLAVGGIISTETGREAGGFASIGPGVGGMFVLSQNPSHPYLIETDPRLTNLGYFYGSEYFLSRMGFNLEASHAMLLGDAFYETRMIREQILAQTGNRYLFEDIADDAETMHRLMDNAAEEGQSLGLTVGTALTSEQIASLTKDIVWLEEQTYMGQTVLVPRLYLADATKATIAVRGAMITGNEIVATSTNITNSGLIQGNTVQLVATEDLLNRGGDIIGTNRLIARADGSLINQSGTIGGGDVLLSAGQDIRLETVMLKNSGLDIRSGQQAEVSSTGTLQLEAGNDILLTGAKIDGGGLTQLHAENDILLGAQAVNMQNSGSGGSVKSYSASMTGQMGSSVSGENLQMSAGNDITLAASSVSAKQDASLTAGGNISMLALEGEQHYALKEKSSSGGLFGKTRAHEMQQDSTSLIGSSITAGGNIAMQAGTDADKGLGSIVMQASNVEGQGDVGMKATGDVIMVSGTESYSSMESNSKKGLLSSQSSLKAEGGTTSVASTISGNNVIINAGEHVLIAGSKVHAENDLGVKAENGDIVVAAAQDTHWSKEETKKSNINLGSIITFDLITSLTGGANLPFTNVDFATKTTEKGVTSNTSNVGSVLTAGNNIKLEAERDVSVIGSAIQAENDLGLFAGRDVNLIPGRDQYSAQYTKKKETIGIHNTFSLSNISTFAGYTSVEQGVERTGDYTAGSYIGAGNDVIISAERDVNQVGSHIEAGRDVALSAGQDWNMLASYDQETLHQYVKEVYSGITGSLRQNVTDAAKTFIDLPEDMTAGKGGAGYTAATAASAGLRAVDSVKGALSEYASASVTAGGSYSKTSYNAESSTARPSSITAGRDVVADVGRDITIEGGQIFGGRDVVLDAERDLLITSAKDSGSSNTKSESGGGGFGLKAGYGSGGAAAGINVNAQAGGSGFKDEYNSHINALIVAGDTLYTSSGRDTTVAGAHLEGDRVWMDVGRDLTVASLQDQYDSKNYSWNVGADVTFGYGFMASGNAGFGQGKTDSDWVGQQTSIVGRSEVDIYVENNTHIKGAIIATEPGGDLTLNTNTLTFEEIKDKNKGYDWSFNVSGSVNNGNGGLDQDTEILGTKPYDYTTKTENGKGGNTEYKPNSLEGNYASHDKEGVLRPTVSEGEIIVRSNSDAETDGSLDGLNRDLGNAREITKDKEAYTDIYVSKQALEEIFNNGEGIASQIEEATKQIRSILETKPDDNYVLINQKLVEKLDELIAAGVDPTIAKLEILNTLLGEEYVFLLENAKNEDGTYDPKVLEIWLQLTTPSLVSSFSSENLEGIKSLIQFSLGATSASGDAAQSLAITAESIARYFNGTVVHPLTGGLLYQEDYEFANNINVELTKLLLDPERLGNLLLQYPEEYRTAFDKAFKQFDHAPNAYERGRAAINLIIVAAPLFTAGTGTGASGAGTLSSAEFPTLSNLTKSIGASTGSLGRVGSTVSKAGEKLPVKPSKVDTSGLVRVDPEGLWQLGAFKSDIKWTNQMTSRDWTPAQISETIKTGTQYSAPNMVNPGNEAIRYVNPTTGKFVVIDRVTKEILQLSGSNFIEKTK